MMGPSARTRAINRPRRREQRPHHSPLRHKPLLSALPCLLLLLASSFLWFPTARAGASAGVSTSAEDPAMRRKLSDVVYDWPPGSHFWRGSAETTPERQASGNPFPRRELPETIPDWPPGSQYWHWFRESAKAAAERLAATAGNDSDSNFGAASVAMPSFEPTYHKGAVLSRNPISVYLIWYGTWLEADKQAIRGFVRALEAATSPNSRPNYKRSLSAKSRARARGPTRVAQRKLALVPEEESRVGAYPVFSQAHSQACTQGAVGCATGTPQRRGRELKRKDKDGGSKSEPLDPGSPGKGAPKPEVFTLRQWWSTTKQYTAKHRKRVAQYVKLQQEHVFPPRSLVQGQNLTRETTQFIVRSAMKAFGGSLPLDLHGIYVVLTSPEIRQQYFCSSSCAYHGFTASGLLRIPPKPLQGIPVAYKPWRGPQVAMAWVGNPSKQCPGYCGFPYIAPDYVPASFAKPVKPPSGKVTTDSMISVLAHELLESATNPFGGGWYTGSSDWPGEVADLCLGSFGPGSFPGFPGYLATTNTGGAYNVVGLRGEKYLLPMYWSNAAEGCVAGSS